MPAWVVKVAYQVAKDPDRAIKKGFMAIMVVLAVMLIFVSPFLLLMPAAEPEQYNEYYDLAEQIKTDTQVELNWQELIAVDAVLKDQDFSDVNTEDLYDFFREQFIKEETITVSAPCKVGNHYETCYTEKKVLTKRPLEEVLNNLKFTEEEKEMVAGFLESDLNELLDLSLNSGGIIVDDNFIPKIGMFSWPTETHRLTSFFGTRRDPITGKSGAFHGGIDFGVGVGTNVYAAAAGKVVVSQFSNSAGNFIEIQHAGGYKTRYLHLSKLLVKVGDKVEQNDLIALSGNTGARTTGPHLHFEIQLNGVKKDPLKFYE